MSQLQQLNRAEEPFQRATIQALVDDVKMAASRGDKIATLTKFDKLRTRAPDVATSSPVVIRSLLLVGELDLADTAVQEGLQKHPFIRDLVLQYCEIARCRSDWEEMARRFDHMRRKFPGDGWPYLMRGVALKELGQFEEAERLIARAIAMEPLISPPAAEYARVAARRGDLDEAIRRWEPVRKNFQELAAWIEPAAIMCELDRQDEAVELLTDAKWRFQGRPEPLIELARISHRRGQLEEAVLQWQTFRALFPQTELGYTGGAQALRELGRVDESESVLWAYAERKQTISRRPG